MLARHVPDRVAGWELLLVGAASILAGVLYTGGPRPYGYEGLGENKTTSRSKEEAGTRERRREAVARRLDRRELRNSPAWIEAKLDQLESGYQPPSTLGGIVAVGKLAMAITKAIRRQAWPESPGWTGPPERARYEIYTLSDDSVAVELDDDARDWLDRVYVPLRASSTM